MKRAGFVLLVLLIATAGACRHAGPATTAPGAPAPSAGATTLSTARPPSDLVRTMGLLAFAADVGLTTLSGDSATTSLAMRTLLEFDALPGIQQATGHDYELVWGPVVDAGKNPGSSEFLITNAMYVAQEQGSNNYVIGIAGTDFRSLFDWAIEDADIKPVTWPYAANAGQVSTGSMTGLQKLQNMKPYPGTMQPGVSLAAYLSSLNQPATIYVTGHSLGGALCEVVAMWLFDTQTTWNPSRNATIVPMSFAGPTPGNSQWAAHFNEAFRNSGAVRVWNRHDVVPHAWNKTLMKQIATLYPQQPTEVEKVAIDAAVIAADLHDYQQVLGDGTSFSTPPYTEIRNLQTNQNVPLTRFSQQAILQHICAYYHYLGVRAPDGGLCP